MKKLALLLVLSIAASVPAAAASKKKPAPVVDKDPQHMTFDEAMAYNKRNLSVIPAALPLILPSWSLPIYFGMNKEADEPTPGKKKKKH